MTKKTLTIFTLAILLRPSLGHTQDAIATTPDSLATAIPKKRFARAAIEAGGSNVVIWAFNRYIREGGENPGFRIGFNSWEENLLNGFEWDDNQFSTNQIAHPYHGTLYFNAARSNGYDFWESIPFAFAGSAMWEYFGEKHHPSINDWIATSVGGVSFGEVLNRFSLMVLNNEATGSGRAWREFGALAINPMRGLNRILDGDIKRVHPNPPDRMPEWLGIGAQFGLRTIGEEDLWQTDTTRVFLRFRFAYNDPWGKAYATPFDLFSFQVQINSRDVTAVGRAQARGMIRSWELDRDEDSAYLFGIEHDYDYINTNAFAYGSQSLGGIFLARWGASGTVQLDAAANLLWIILGGTSSDHESYTGRNYDYGPGAGSKLSAILRYKGRQFFAFNNDLYYLRIFNGTDANHVVMETRASLDLPLRGALGIGVEYAVYNAERRYKQYPDVSQRNPQLQAYFSWIP